MLRWRAHGNADGRVIAVKDELVDQHVRWVAMLQDQAVPVYRWVYMHVGNREQAEALTVHVLDEAAHEEPAEAMTDKAARERLFTIARAVVTDELRAFYGAAAGVALERMQRLPVEDVDSMTTDDPDRANLPAARMHQLLSRLPAREAEVLTCRFLLGYPIDRTAAQLHLSVAETMALQFVALTHASQLDATEHGQVTAPSPALEKCGCC